jgi:transcriptional regulator with XRE-family HTH domain
VPTLKPRVCADPCSLAWAQNFWADRRGDLAQVRYTEAFNILTQLAASGRFRTLPARNAMISAAQCRSARALLGWSVAKLASAASVSASAIDDFEAERRAPLPVVAGPIRRAFEPVGVAFLPGEDVRLRQGRSWRRQRPRSRATASQKPSRLTASHAGRDPSVE